MAVPHSRVERDAEGIEGVISRSAKASLGKELGEGFLEEVTHKLSLIE